MRATTRIQCLARQLLLVPALALLSCSAGPALEPGTITFLIESTPANLDPRIGTDVQSERIHSLLFSSQRVRPAALLGSGYTFHHPDLDTALRALLGRPAATQPAVAAPATVTPPV